MVNNICFDLEYLHIAGQSQSPAGSFAMTSTRPYFMPLFPLVLRRADWTGGIIIPLVSFERTEHALMLSPVQLPSPPACVKLSV
jgi:hypothetical protein